MIDRSSETDVHLDLLAAHRLMCTIRAFEETALEKLNEGVAYGSLHLYVGMEAIAAGVFPSLRPGDWFISTHRGHGHTLASGVSPVQMFAELFGREAGVCRGKAGSVHMGGTGIVGDSIHLGAGAALTLQLRSPGSVAIAFFGDGAANHGTFHEGLNLAALWKLPVVFICENNGFGQWTRHEAASSVATVAERAAAYGIPGSRHEGNDVVHVFDAARHAIDRARVGEGPTLLEFVTYRTRDHSGGRDQRQYREASEIEQWRAKDPIKLCRERILLRNIATAAAVNTIEEESLSTVKEAADEAAGLPLADVNGVLDDITDYD